MLNKTRNLLALLLIVCSSLPLMAQRTNQAYWTYIDKYKDWAIEQMKNYRIPASITLAQGLLESNAGRSTLATEANNHFGIKCGGSWTGPYVLRNDDAPNEKFRKYRSARESFIDHSVFLQGRRYQGLYSLRITDYRGWARGLKAAGYATSPTYAESLIRIIEMYGLSQFDSGKYTLLTQKKGVVSIQREGSVPKFVEQVRSVSFSAKRAIANGQKVLYVTERCVFRLTPKGLKLIEAYPGVDVQKDIIDRMPFEIEV